MPSRSRIRYFGGSRSKQALTTCCPVHAAVGLRVTRIWTISLVAWWIRKNTYSVWNVSVLTQQKSHAQMSFACCARNSCHCGEGLPDQGRRMYRRTVLGETTYPTFSTPALIRTCPHGRFSAARRRISCRSSSGIRFLPGLARFDFQRQYVRQPLRCHTSTVAGVTSTRQPRQPLNHRHIKIQKRRSVFRRAGRGCLRARIANCWRRHRFSAARRVLDLNPASRSASSQRMGYFLPGCFCCGALYLPQKPRALTPARGTCCGRGALIYLPLN